MQKKISTTKAPGAIGPYSQAVEIDNLVYTSGQLGVDPATGELVEGVEAQTKMALENVKAVLAEFEITDAVVSLVDKGAFDWVIRSRMQAACCRATETKFNWKGED